MKKTLCLLLCAVMLLSMLTACGGQSEDLKSPSAGQASDNGVYPMTFDNYGRQVTVAKKPERVLTLGPNCTELFAALGLQDYVVGRSLINHSRGPLKEYADAVNAIPELNYSSATREAIISSGADFIYALPELNFSSRVAEE